MQTSGRLKDEDHGFNSLPNDQSAELIQDLCRSFQPLAEKMHAGLEEILNTRDSNDAIVLFPPLLVVMLRTLKHLQLPLVVHALELENRPT